MSKIVVSKVQWLALGLAYFSSGGVKALNVEKMAKTLGGSKSSFYWHFKNRALFIEQVLNYWVEQGTDNIIDKTEQVSSPAEKLILLLKIIFRNKQGQDFLFYLREISQTKEKYAHILNEAENTRINYVAAILQELGLDSNNASEKATIFYNYYLGWYEQNKYVKTDEAEIRQQTNLLIKHLSLPISINNE